MGSASAGSIADVPDLMKWVFPVRLRGVSVMLKYFIADTSLGYFAKSPNKFREITQDNFVLRFGWRRAM